MKNGKWIELLQCNLIKWYEINSTTLCLFLEHQNHCDMTGCIEFCKGLMPSVNLILVWSGTKQDTCYRQRSSKWEAFKMPLNAPECP